MEETKKKSPGTEKRSPGVLIWDLCKKIIRFVMGICLKLFHIQWDESQWESFFQFVRFCMVGVSNTLVSYLVNVVTLFLLSKCRIGYDYIIANVMAFLLSVLWAYGLSSRFVFDVSGRTRKEKLQTLMKSYASYAVTGLVLNNILSAFWIHVLHLSKYVAPLLNIVFCVPVNFLLNKKWAYKS